MGGILNKHVLVSCLEEDSYMFITECLLNISIYRIDAFTGVGVHVLPVMNLAVGLHWLVVED